MLEELVYLRRDVRAGLSYPVRVHALRSMYGRVEAEIRPVGGRGSRWVTAGELGPAVRCARCDHA